MQFGSAIDKLADSGQASASGILNVTSRIGGAAVAMKMTAQETIALGTALLDTKSEAELAAGALLDFMGSLNETKGRKGIAKTLGMDMVEFTKLVETGPMQVIQKFLSALKQMDSLGQKKTLVSIGVDSNIHQGEIQKLALVSDQLAKYVGLANHEFKTLDQITKSYATTAELAWSGLAAMKNQLQAAADAVGSFLLPAFNRLTSGLGEAMESFRKFIGDNGPMLESWAAAIEDKVGVGTAALKHWQLALDVASEWVKEKLTNAKESFDWLLANLPPIMDRVADAIVDGFEDGMRRAIAAIKANMPTIKSLLIGGNAIPRPGADLIPRRQPRAFSDLKLTENPGLKDAQDRFNAAKGADDVAREAARNADAVAKAEKEAAEARAAESRRSLADRRGVDLSAKPDRSLAGPFANRFGDSATRDFNVGRNRGSERAGDLGTHERKTNQSLAEQIAEAGRAIQGLAPGGDGPKTSSNKSGVSDVDSYARELQDAALKGKDLAAEQAKAAQETATNTAIIAKNTEAQAKGKALSTFA
jgi:hypothetical protein